MIKVGDVVTSKPENEYDTNLHGLGTIRVTKLTDPKYFQCEWPGCGWYSHTISWYEAVPPGEPKVSPDETIRRLFDEFHEGSLTIKELENALCADFTAKVPADVAAVQQIREFVAAGEGIYRNPYDYQQAILGFIDNGPRS